MLQAPQVVAPQQLPVIQDPGPQPLGAQAPIALQPMSESDIEAYYRQTTPLRTLREDHPYYKELV